MLPKLLSYSQSLISTHFDALVHTLVDPAVYPLTHLMKVTRMASAISKKRAAVSSITSTGSKKRKVEIQTTLSAALHW